MENERNKMDNGRQDLFAQIPFNYQQVTEGTFQGWMESILVEHGHYPIYATFLVLEGDTDAVEYLKHNANELHWISGENCLIITITSRVIRKYSSKKMRNQCLVDEKVIEDSIKKGYSLMIAEIFDVKINQFPCLLIFTGIRNPRHILVSLHKLDKEEIRDELRSLFTVVNDAVKGKTDPILQLEHHYKEIDKTANRKQVWISVRSFAGKTLEALMKAIISASFEWID